MINELIILAIANIENEEERNFIEKLYNDYSPLIRNTISNILIKNTTDIEDLVHDVIIKLINKIPLLLSFENKYIMISYISKAAKRVALNSIKSRVVNSEWTFYSEEEDVAESIADERNLPEEVFIINENSENLNKVLKQLPDKYRLLLQFKYFFEMEDIEIAKIFNISPGSVKVYISRARKMAYKLFKERGIEYEPK